MTRGVIEKAWAFGWRELSIAKAERGTEMMVDGVQRAVADRVQKAVADRVQKAAVDRMQKAMVPTDLKTPAIMMIVMHPPFPGTYDWETKSCSVAGTSGMFFCKRQIPLS